MNEIIHTELLPGTVLCSGKYIIEEKIGSGGFGITYLAKHTALEKKIAIKEFFLEAYNVRNSVTNNIGLQGIDYPKFEHFRQCFKNEAKTLAALNNDAIVKVSDIFDENGTSYMVMPFVEGITLQKMVEVNGPMECDMAVNYIVRICDALSYIHSRNILHRDVTPDNIIVTPEQKTVLIDFGSARKFINNKTQRHTRLLKFGYAPLEQHSETSRKGAYTDLYSLGGVFYYILTGVRPTDATERTMGKMKEPIELNPEIPEQINAVIMKAMAMDCSERYQSADELEKDILSGNMPKMRTIAEVSTEVEKQSKKNVVKRNCSAARKHTAIALFFLATAILFICSIIFYANKPSSIEYRPSPKEQYSIAMSKLNSDNIDTLRVGLYMMDKLCTEDYIPAIYQMAFTYGWFSDSISVKRKKKLGIVIDENFMPISDEYNKTAVELFTRIKELNDPSEADINANASYRMALYYTEPNSFYQNNHKKALDFLLVSRQWAELAKDTILLESINKGIKIVEKRISEIK